MMCFTTLALVACVALGAVMADVSHLTKTYIPPSTMMPASASTGAAVRPNNGPATTQKGQSIVTSIERQELLELPTQTEYLQPGQMPYGFGAASNNQNGMPASGHGTERSLEMLMPRELLPPPPPAPLKQEEQPTITSTNLYAAPLEKKAAAEQANKNSMPIQQYLTPTMNLSEEQQQMSSATAHSNQHTQQEHSAPAPLVHISRVPAVATPANVYLAPPAMPSDEQQVQQQSAPAARYVPPQQQQMPEMPASHYLPPQVQVQVHQMQMQPSQESQASPVSHYSSPALKMPLKLMDIVPQMPPARQYLSPFGEAENIAEAAQEAAEEAAEMFDAQLAHQPMPPAAVDESANYYFPPLPTGAPQLSYQQYHEQQSAQLAPVDFVRQHHRLMTQFGSGIEAPVPFTQFETISSAASNLQTAPAPMPAHLLANDGYHYRDGVNSLGLSDGKTKLGRLHVRQ